MHMTVQSSAMSNKDLEEEVNEDINEFEKWFCANVDPSTGALSGPEVAIIKTYLWWLTHPGEKPNETSSS